MKKRYLIALGALSLVALASCGNSTSQGKDFSKLDDATKDAMGRVNDNLELSTYLELDSTSNYFYTAYGYYFYAPNNGNITAKSFFDSSYSVDSGIAKADAVNWRENGKIYEAVTSKNSKYNHIFFNYRGEKIYEVETNSNNTFTVESYYYSLPGNFDSQVEYTKYTFKQNDVKFDIYQKESDSLDNIPIFEYSTTKFDSTEVVKDAYKTGDYYIKCLTDTTDRIWEIYDKEGKLDDTLVLEDGTRYKSAAHYGLNTILYQATIPVAKTEKYDYYSNNVYYKIDSYMLNVEKRSLKHLNLDYVVIDCADENIGEYACITYSSIVDGLLEYTSLGLVDEDFDLKYSLKNEDDLRTVKGGAFSMTTGKLYDKDFKEIKQFVGGTYDISIDRSYIIATYESGKYYVFYDTTTGNVIAEGSSDKITYSNNLIVKYDQGVASYYDVVNGSLSLKYKSDETNKNIVSKSNFYCVVEKDTTNNIYAYKLSQYGSTNVLTLYYGTNSYDNFEYVCANDNYRFYSSSLYTDTALTKHASVIRTSNYILN